MTDQQSAFSSNQGGTTQSRAEQGLVREPEVTTTDRNDTSTSLFELSAILIPILVGIAATLMFAVCVIVIAGH
jgi:hypothetical protein